MLRRTTTLFLFVFALFAARHGGAQQVMSTCAVTPGSATQLQTDQSSNGAPIRFPNSGTVNALVIFVQYADDKYRHPEGQVSCPASPYNPPPESWTSDPETEWPACRSLGSNRKLPKWAEGDKFLADPGTSPSNFAPGSISAYYDLLSGGDFTLTGHVYPETYVVPEPPNLGSKRIAAWYGNNPGSFPNGAVRLSHEILTSSGVQNYVNSFSNPAAIFDNYTNGNGKQDPLQPDNKFDMIILVYRNSFLSQLTYGDNRGSGTAITTLGARTSYRAGDNAFSSDSVTLGGLQVIDNNDEGSGVIVQGTNGYSDRTIMSTIGWS